MGIYHPRPDGSVRWFGRVEAEMLEEVARGFPQPRPRPSRFMDRLLNSPGPRGQMARRVYAELLQLSRLVQVILF